MSDFFPSPIRRRPVGLRSVFGLGLLLSLGLVWWSIQSEVVRPARANAEAPAVGSLEVGIGLAVFGDAERLPDLDEAVLESSGLSASRTRPGWLWTHEDSGNGPWLLWFDPQTGESEKWSVRGATQRDWEDMASFELEGRPYLLLADTGDNARNRASVALHVFEEPSGQLVSGRGAGEEEPLETEAGPAPVLSPGLTLHVTYADGPRDCEAVAVDPVGRTVWLLSKEINSRGRTFGGSGLYRVTLPAFERWAAADPIDVGTAETPLVLERVATLSTVMPTGMDITADGANLVVSTYADGLLFRRDPVRDTDWTRAVAAGPQRVVLPPRRQGEGVCFSLDGSAVFLTSEKKGQPVWRLPVDWE